MSLKHNSLLIFVTILAIEETGDIPFHVLQPILEKATPIQLFRLEEINPVKNF